MGLEFGRNRLKGHEAFVPEALHNHSLGQSPQVWHRYPFFALTGRDKESIANGMEPGSATRIVSPHQGEYPTHFPTWGWHPRLWLYCASGTKKRRTSAKLQGAARNAPVRSTCKIVRLGLHFVPGDMLL